jgi:hypothetical protein
MCRNFLFVCLDFDIQKYNVTLIDCLVPMWGQTRLLSNVEGREWGQYRGSSGAVSSALLIAKARVQLNGSLCESCGGRSGKKIGLSSEHFLFLVRIIILPMLLRNRSYHPGDFQLPHYTPHFKRCDLLQQKWYDHTGFGVERGGERWQTIECSHQRRHAETVQYSNVQNVVHSNTEHSSHTSFLYFTFWKAVITNWAQRVWLHSVKLCMVCSLPTCMLWQCLSNCVACSFHGTCNVLSTHHAGYFKFKFAGPVGKQKSLFIWVPETYVTFYPAVSMLNI